MYIAVKARDLQLTYEEITTKYEEFTPYIRGIYN